MHFWIKGKINFGVVSMQIFSANKSHSLAAFPERQSKGGSRSRGNEKIYYNDPLGVGSSLRHCNNKAPALIYIPLEPRRLFLFCQQKRKQKTVVAAPASLKIVFITLNRKNLTPLHSVFKQPALLRSINPIFLTLTS